MDILVYSHSNCIYCNHQKQWMKENNIEFQEKDILTDQESYMEFLKIKAPGTPFTIIKTEETEHQIIGFNKDELTTLLIQKNTVEQ
ncbi:MAG: glutaredoxin family protein [Bacillus cereus]|nr:glutaredoxin family protein [Bacillus cereus]